MSDDDEREPNGFGFGIPLPPELATAIVSQHERAHMRQEAAIMEVQHFFDSLNVAQLLSLRRILNSHEPAETNQFFDGQLLQILRLGHKVDPDTGQPIDDELAGLVTPAPVAPSPESDARE